jgi:hypothetical protein
MAARTTVVSPPNPHVKASSEIVIPTLCGRWPRSDRHDSVPQLASERKRLYLTALGPHVSSRTRWSKEASTRQEGKYVYPN